MAQGGRTKSHAGVFARSLSHLPAPPSWRERGSRAQVGWRGGKDSTFVEIHITKQLLKHTDIEKRRVSSVLWLSDQQQHHSRTVSSVLIHSFIH